MNEISPWEYRHGPDYMEIQYRQPKNLFLRLSSYLIDTGILIRDAVSPFCFLIANGNKNYSEYPEMQVRLLNIQTKRKSV